MSIRLDPEEAELKALAAFAADFDGKRILEVGCGTGRLTWRYLDRAAHMVGIDPNAARLSRAVADTPPRLRDRAEFHVADIDAFAAAPSGKFDTIILAWSL